ncbi:MAG: glycoside hydrolase [Planctomycetia bacterium]|nr:glycoside hydrolase [Planctomycetia bacterium]
MGSFLQRSALLLGVLALASPAQADEPALRIERAVVLKGLEKYYFTQSRGAVIPGAPRDRIMIVSQETEKEGSHGYRDLWAIESRDHGTSWSEPARIESLARTKLPNGDELAIGDVTPTWHARTKTVLATGKTFTFRGGTKEDRLAEQVSYAVYVPGNADKASSGQWSELRILKLPEVDKAGYPLVSPNSGCMQRVDLPDGDILLPIRYRRGREATDYTAFVARCKFDGKTLSYVEHGNELVKTNGRGYGEPSLVKFGNRYFLTIRNEVTGYVTRSDDGLTYEPPIDWKYDDGTLIGTYNTQQHWVAHEPDGLYLVYTRRGAGNDHIFRHRAPLFIAKVDPDRLCILRATEQILIPHDHADLGNFGVVQVSPTETWVVAAEGLAFGQRKAERNKVIAAKIDWSPRK